MDQEQSLLVVKPGDRIRIRILNAGETVEEVHPHGHDMQVVAQDGNPLPPNARPFLDTLKIGPAERFDVVMTMDNPGPWMIHTHVSSHETNCGRSPGGMHTMLVYEEYLDRMHAFKAELPASGPPGCELRLPGDFVNYTSFATGAGSASPPAPPLPPNPAVPTPFAATWSWPIELVCGVKKMAFTAHLSSPASQSTFLLQGDIKNTKGESVQAFSLGGSAESASYVLEKEGLLDLSSTPGNYTVEITGQAVQGDLTMFAHVDYHTTLEETKRDHLKYKVGGCPGFT